MNRVTGVTPSLLQEKVQIISSSTSSFHKKETKIPLCTEFYLHSHNEMYFCIQLLLSNQSHLLNQPDCSAIILLSANPLSTAEKQRWTGSGGLKGREIWRYRMTKNICPAQLCSSLQLLPHRPVWLPDKESTLALQCYLLASQWEPVLKEKQRMLHWHPASHYKKAWQVFGLITCFVKGAKNYRHEDEPKQCREGHCE